ncbi:MAG: ABC transporter permease [Acidobacteriia bacterium]|nr:ABC transporter permease [Terriglobia bacterium]
MATTTAALTTSSHQPPTRKILTVYWKEAKYEFLKNLRLRMYSVATIFFPLMFYVLFGLVLGRRSMGGFNPASYLIPTYGTFGVIGASLFGTAAGLAAERGLGWLQVKRASPMPTFAYFTAKIAMSMAFSAVVVLLLMLLGVTLGGVHLPLWQAAKLLGVLVAGSLPFCAMGLAIGYFAGPNSAPATINMIYLPLSFCSGLWVPIMFLPKLLQQIAEFLPAYHLSQLALGVVGAGRQESNWTHWQYLIGFTLICLGVARFGLQRDEGKLYG